MILNIDALENTDHVTADLLFLRKTGRVKNDGSSTAKYTHYDQAMVAFRAGQSSRVHSECMDKANDVSGLRPHRLRLKTEALIMQNPPRQVRPYAKLP